MHLYNNILLNLSVELEDRYTGNWRTALDEAYTLSKELNIGCCLNYAGQYKFRIYPTMSQEDIDKIKESKIVIGL